MSFQSFSNLPPPVARYFRHVLSDGQGLIGQAKMCQTGALRGSPTVEAWLPFTANQLVVPTAVGFVWNAKVAMPLATHLRVLDSYGAGIGSGSVSLLSMLSIATEAGLPELNSGALQRYLAEAVWFPTALLPQSGVEWSAIDDYSALATLTDHGTSVSLEFRFNEVGEVAAIYSPGRFGKFGDGYKRVPWEGHFRDYQTRSGMRVPLFGEVGWYCDGTLQMVWKADVSGLQYELGPRTAATAPL